jgi:hypothetical protein
MLIEDLPRNAPVADLDRHLRAIFNSRLSRFCRLGPGRMEHVPRPKWPPRPLTREPVYDVWTVTP